MELRRTGPAIFAEAEEAPTREQSAAVRAFVEAMACGWTRSALSGSTAKSVLHQAPQPGRIGATRQLGNGALMHDSAGRAGGL